jgi:hypothetical protein
MSSPLKIASVAAPMARVAATRKDAGLAITQHLERRRRKRKPILFRIKPPTQKSSLRRPRNKAFTTRTLSCLE